MVKHSTSANPGSGQAAVPVRPALQGGTQLYGIIGAPVRQAKAPQVVTERLQAAGIDAVLVPFDVAPEDVPGFVDWVSTVRNLHGFIVTIPHKAAVVPLVKSVSPRSRLSGVANVVRREPDGSLYADILDGAAFVLGLRRQGVELSGRRVALAGAGGAGRAVAWALFDAGIASLSIRELDMSRAQHLAAELRTAGHDAVGVEDFTAPADLLVNASPAGMGSDRGLPFPPELLRANVVAADLVMEPKDTAFLQAAAAAGCKVHHGHHLLDAQLEMFDEFFGFTRHLSSSAASRS